MGDVTLPVPKFLRWVMALGIAALVTVVPYVRYRWVYADTKRLREVTPGVFYRCGWMTAEGFTDAIERYKIRTVINAQDDVPDPDLNLTYASSATVKESELCKRLQVKYVNIAPDLVPPPQLAVRRPAAIDQYLKLLDDPKVYPVLLHCRAGLHRTGLLTAIYRMEYQGWPMDRAYVEMRANGFGESVCWTDNDYVVQYLLSYQPGQRHSVDATGALRIVRPEEHPANYDGGLIVP